MKLIYEMFQLAYSDMLKIPQQILILQMHITYEAVYIPVDKDAMQCRPH
jgi:hypothetical protein